MVVQTYCNFYISLQASMNLSPGANTKLRERIQIGIRSYASPFSQYR